MALVSVVGSWWRRRSLRVQVTAGAVVVVTVGVALVAAGIMFGVQYTLLATLDRSAFDRARDVAALADQGKLGPLIPSAATDASAVQLLDGGGRVVSSSADLEGNGPFIGFPLPDALRGGGPLTVTELPIGNGEGYRVVTQPAQLNAQPVTVVVALSLGQEQRSVTILAVGLAVGLPVLILLVGAMTWTLTGHTLGPVEAMRRKVEEISASDLHRRVELPPSRDGIYRLARTLNQMLARLESASTAQRHFVADAAHELRSPLTAALAEVETGVHASDPHIWNQLGPVLLADLNRLSTLMDDLLTLARLDDPAYLNNRRVIDLDDIVYAEVTRLRHTTGRTIDATAVSAVQITADPGAMTRVVRNLLDNAARHAHSRLAVTLATTLHGNDPTVELTVADDGPGVPPQDRSRIFTRFTRLDHARNRDGGGTGLGLAIVRELITAHDGRVWISGPPPTHRGVTYPGAWVHIQLPPSPPPPPPTTPART